MGKADLKNFVTFNSLVLTIISSIGMFLGSCLTANAEPLLQLDIGGGSYDTATETIVSTTDIFTLYALLTDPAPGELTDIYYISAAITPQVGPDNLDIGSFTFGGITIKATEDMTYGQPPLHDVDSGISDPGDIPPHGIFDTFYTEFVFQFDSTMTTSTYNAQNNPGGINTDGTGTYYQDFSVDTSGISGSYVVHFDLYSTTPTDIPTLGECVKYAGNSSNCKVWKVLGHETIDYDVNSFAPFSHDAESHAMTPVPEPGTMVLVGSGLVGLLGGWRRKRKNV